MNLKCCDYEYNYISNRSRMFNIYSIIPYLNSKYIMEYFTRTQKQIIMTIEQKAQRYNEALKKAKKLYEQGTITESLSYVFPELKESEDEKIKSDIQYAVRCAYGDQSEQTNKILAWLDKQGEQNLANSAKTCKDEQKPAWSEEDEQYVKDTLALLAFGASVHTISQVQDWLNSLKDRVLQQNITYYNPYKEVVESIAEMCKHYDKASHNGLRDFYDNVKVKCKDAKEYDSLYPQFTWKPSDEQIKALNYVVNLMASSESPKENDYYYNVFKNLREQLQKQKGRKL